MATSYGREVLAANLNWYEVETMDIDKMVADLKKEQERLGRAVAALLGIGSAAGGKRRGRPPGAPKKRRGGLTAAGRKRLSEMMKKRWAERRKKGA